MAVLRCLLCINGTKNHVMSYKNQKNLSDATSCTMALLLPSCLQKWIKGAFTAINSFSNSTFSCVYFAFSAAPKNYETRKLFYFPTSKNCKTSVCSRFVLPLTFSMFFVFFHLNSSRLMFECMRASAPITPFSFFNFGLG